MDKDTVISCFDNVLLAFRYARNNYLSYKYLDSLKSNYVHNLAPEFFDSYKFASQMSTLLVVLNLLDVDSEFDKKKGYETITLDWLFTNMETLSENTCSIINECKQLVSSIDNNVLKKSRTLRHKYFAHMDVKIFGEYAYATLISYGEFDPVVDVIEKVFKKLYFILKNEECYYFEETHTDLEDLLKNII